MTATPARFRLRALDGEPLADPVVARTVLATARAIAERTGVDLRSIEHDARTVTVALAAGPLETVAFLAELRRLTNAWHAGRTGRDPLRPSLWGDAPETDSGQTFDLGEPWR